MWVVETQEWGTDYKKYFPPHSLNRVGTSNTNGMVALLMADWWASESVRMVGGGLAVSSLPAF